MSKLTEKLTKTMFLVKPKSSRFKLGGTRGFFRYKNIAFTSLNLYSKTN